MSSKNDDEKNNPTLHREKGDLENFFLALVNENTDWRRNGAPSDWGERIVSDIDTQVPFKLRPNEKFTSTWELREQLWQSYFKGELRLLQQLPRYKRTQREAILRNKCLVATIELTMREIKEIIDARITTNRPHSVTKFESEDTVIQRKMTEIELKRMQRMQNLRPKTAVYDYSLDADQMVASVKRQEAVAARYEEDQKRLSEEISRMRKVVNKSNYG